LQNKISKLTRTQCLLARQLEGSQASFDRNIGWYGGSLLCLQRYQAFGISMDDASEISL
jgi:hypothetical protein